MKKREMLNSETWGKANGMSGPSARRWAAKVREDGKPVIPGVVKVLDRGHWDWRFPADAKIPKEYPTCPQRKRLFK